MAALASESSTLAREDDVEVYVRHPGEAGGEVLELGSGTLIVTTKAITWQGTERECSITYPNLLIHAVCNEAYEKPCLYCQVADFESAGQVISGTSEVRFVPGDESKLESLFQHFCKGSEMNPGESDNEDNDEAIIEASSARDSTAVGEAEATPDLIGKEVWCRGRRGSMIQGYLPASAEDMAKLQLFEDALVMDELRASRIIINFVYLHA